MVKKKMETFYITLICMHTINEEEVVFLGLMKMKCFIYIISFGFLPYKIISHQK